MSETPACRLEIDADQIGWLTLDKPGSSANTLGRAVLEDLQRQMETAQLLVSGETGVRFSMSEKP